MNHPPDEEHRALVAATAAHVRGILDTLRDLDLGDTPPAAAYAAVPATAKEAARAAV